MLSEDFRKVIAPQAKVLNIIWGAFSFATLIYAFIAWIMFGMNTSAALETPDLTHLGPLSLNQVGILVVVILGLAGTYYHRYALSPPVLRKKVPDQVVWPPEGSQNIFDSKGESTAAFERLSESDKKLVGLWPHYQTSLIVTWALLEAISVVGMVLAILQREWVVVVPMSGVSLLLMIMKRPRVGSFFENVRL